MRELAEAAGKALVPYFYNGTFPMQANLVEFGCGTGLLSMYLLQHIPELDRVLGIDLSPNMVQAFNTKAKQLHDPRPVEAVHLNMLNMTAEQSNTLSNKMPYADIIMAHLTLHHIEDPVAALKALRLQFFRKRQSDSQRQWMVVSEFVKSAHSEMFHPRDMRSEVAHHGFSPEELDRMLADAGFHTVTSRKIHQFMKPTAEHGMQSFDLLLTIAECCF